MDALKRIEERHKLDNGACVGYYCQPNPDDPCDVMKLARAIQAHLDALGHYDPKDCEVGHGCTLCGLVRVLEEVAGEPVGKVEE